MSEMVKGEEGRRKAKSVRRAEQSRWPPPPSAAAAAAATRSCVCNQKPWQTPAAAGGENHAREGKPLQPCHCISAAAGHVAGVSAQNVIWTEAGNCSSRGISTKRRTAREAERQAATAASDGRRGRKQARHREQQQQQQQTARERGARVKRVSAREEARERLGNRSHQHTHRDAAREVRSFW